MKLLDRVRKKLLAGHYSLRTEEAYWHWIVRYIRWHGLRHPQEMGAAEIESFLTYLATERNISKSTQNQALSALLFLYRQVLAREVGDLNAVRALQPSPYHIVSSRVPVEATCSEAPNSHPPLRPPRLGVRLLPTTSKKSPANSDSIPILL